VAAPRLAVFDLDGTLTRHDSFVRFLAVALARWPVRWLRLPLALPALLAFALGLSDRGRLKGALLRGLLGGLPRNELAGVASAFARQLVASGLHVQAQDVIAAHRGAGDRLVLMSASPDVYVPLVGQLLGFDETTCTAIRWNGDRLDGRLAGPNCRGAEKSERLAVLRQAHPGRQAIAYGNTRSDLEHMRACDSAVYVNAHGPLRRELEAEGIRVVDWH
jgi:phosphatidylglycerophosphatase C